MKPDDDHLVKHGARSQARIAPPATVTPTSTSGPTAAMASAVPVSQQHEEQQASSS